MSFLAFFLVLRSAKLALIGLVPNVLPVGVLFGAMPLGHPPQAVHGA